MAPRNLPQVANLWEVVQSYQAKKVLWGAQQLRVPVGRQNVFQNVPDIFQETV